MRVAAGLFSPKLGFLHLDFIDIRDAADWFLAIDLRLRASGYFIFSGQPVRPDDLTPMLTYDPKIEWLLQRSTSVRCIK